MIESTEQACHYCLETKLGKFSEVDENYILGLSNKRFNRQFDFDANHIFNQTVNDGVAHSEVQTLKCLYHVTFDLDLDLEHTLDAGPSGDHRVQVWWRSSYLSGRRSDLCKMFTDRQTDDGRRTIA